MKLWIAHPAADQSPVSFGRWLKWHFSQWMLNKGRNLEYDALYPNCEGCGEPRRRGNHAACMEIPF